MCVSFFFSFSLRIDTNPKRDKHCGKTLLICINLNFFFFRFLGPNATLSDLDLIKNSGITIQDLDKDTPKRRKIRKLIGIFFIWKTTTTFAGYVKQEPTLANSNLNTRSNNISSQQTQQSHQITYQQPQSSHQQQQIQNVAFASLEPQQHSTLLSRRGGGHHRQVTQLVQQPQQYRSSSQTASAIAFSSGRGNTSQPHQILLQRSDLLDQQHNTRLLNHSRNSSPQLQQMQIVQQGVYEGGPQQQIALTTVTPSNGHHHQQHQTHATLNAVPILAQPVSTSTGKRYFFEKKIQTFNWWDFQARKRGCFIWRCQTISNSNMSSICHRILFRNTFFFSVAVAEARRGPSEYKMAATLKSQ